MGNTDTATRGRLRAGIYARQSHGEEKSIEEQVADSLDDADDQGYEVVETYRDYRSASRFARERDPHYDRLVADLAAGRLDVLVAWETSRGSRHMPGWTALLDLCWTQGVLIRDSGEHETYDMNKSRDRQHLWHEGIKNAEYSEETSRRLKRDARYLAKNGLPNGPCPFGFVRDYEWRTVTTKDGKRKQKRFPIQTEDPEAAPIVEEVFKRVAAGEPVKPLADDLNERGVPTAGQWRGSNGRYSHRWTPHGVRAMVKNVAYIGKRRHAPRDGDKPETYDTEVWPALVDEDVFYAANRVLDERAKRYWRSSRAEHVLSGIPRCERCNDARRGVLSGSAQGRHGSFYACRKCGVGIANGPALEEMVVGFVLVKLTQPDVFSKLRTEGEITDAEKAAADAEVRELEHRFAEWEQAAIDGKVSPERWDNIEAGLNKKIAAARQRAERAGMPPNVRRLAEAAEAGQDLADVFGAMKLAAQRDVIAELVDVRVAPVGRGRSVPLDERVTITLKAGS